MPCSAPIRIKGENGLRQMVACGHCLSCAIRRQKSWVLRIQLEQSDHECSSFWTLTYADHACPENLSYEHIASFMRQSRKSLGASSVRFFCIGEYGSLTQRPHWHLILFGVPCLKPGLLHIKQWPYGACFVGNVTPASAAYTARYSLKSGPKGGQFVMQASRRPGIGVRRAREIAAHLATQQKTMALPSWWRLGEKSYPLDKTLREHIKSAYVEAGGTVTNETSPITLDIESHVHALLGDPLSQSQSSNVRHAQREFVGNGTF